jgi:hypothetical protein
MPMMHTFKKELKIFCLVTCSRVDTWALRVLNDILYRIRTLNISFITDPQHIALVHMQVNTRTERPYGRKLAVCCDLFTSSGIWWTEIPFKMNASTNSSLIQAANHESSPSNRCRYVYLITSFLYSVLRTVFHRDSRQDSFLVVKCCISKKI